MQPEPATAPAPLHCSLAGASHMDDAPGSRVPASITSYRNMWTLEQSEGCLMRST